MFSRKFETLGAKKNIINTDVFCASEAQNHSIYDVFNQQQNFAMGSLAQISSAIRCSFKTRFWARLPEGSGGFPCIYLLRFRRVPVQIPGEVLEGSGADTWWGSGADTWWGSGGFRCRYLVRFWKVPVQIPGEVLADSGSGGDTRWGFGRFRCRYLAVEVPKSSGADSRRGSGGFQCRYLVRLSRVRCR